MSATKDKSRLKRAASHQIPLMCRMLQVRVLKLFGGFEDFAAVHKGDLVERPMLKHFPARSRMPQHHKIR